MTKKLDTIFIQIAHPVCCGLDVHKKKISVCLITMDEQCKEQYEIKEFGTFTNDLLEMKKWLTDNNCPILAMESIGGYWRPVHNVIEGFMEVILVNARHIKNVPGRKTDISDCKWLAGLLRYGLLKGSLIPPKEIRQWRELTRFRSTQNPWVIIKDVFTSFLKPLTSRYFCAFGTQPDGMHRRLKCKVIFERALR